MLQRRCCSSALNIGRSLARENFTAPTLSTGLKFGGIFNGRKLSIYSSNLNYNEIKTCHIINS